MNEAQQIAEAISKLVLNTKSGTLRFWGYWFGRPHDNIHKIVSAIAEEGFLRLLFNLEETLSVWEPSGAIVSPGQFQIMRASHIRWEWFAYVRPKSPLNRYFMDFLNTESGIVASTNVDSFAPDFDRDIEQAAVEIL